ncbi:hypothetical protein SAMN05443432_11812 [Roseovarius litoreus]|uniref:Amidohydrolase 3 domain-containing protein n=1 Tax=Roseovarius litoreus TaxID=1155722 RepID=A0A1M7LM01_9RHOB|nr:amidohydrolase [Roseovarius litoreus]SHM79073.1 hypothetical protein SAMN05443432_11812 [Roseovarius litoreus]
MSKISVYTAKRIITMDPGRPFASAVAVMDGRIVSVGTLASIAPWLEHYEYEIDDSFANKVIMPGLVEPHTHLRWSGNLASLHYVGPVEAPAGTGPALNSREEVIDRLRAVDAAMDDPNRPLFAWGFDPAVHGGHLNRHDLDAISTTRPVWVLSYAVHFLYVNSAMLDLLDIDPGLNVHGLGRDADGTLNGVFAEMEATRLAMDPFKQELSRPGGAAEGLRALSTSAIDAGITTTADLGVGLNDFDAECRDYHSAVPDSGFPLRMVLVPTGVALRDKFGSDGPRALAELRNRNTEKLRYNGVKFWSDGAYQAMSLRVGFPGYLDGTNGLRGDLIWDEMAETLLPYWEAGEQLHVHANGDEAVQAVLDALDQLQQRKPRFDHRFTIEHFPVASTQQIRRLARLGGQASVNNYLTHYRAQLQNLQGLGPDRAETTARLGSMAREGVTFGLHSDFALVVVPMRPLVAAWIATTRMSRDRTQVLAPGERIELDRALRAITIDAAYLLRMEDDIGSLEPGKLADFAILESDPYEAPETLDQVKVWGTVLGGRKFQSQRGQGQ